MLNMFPIMIRQNTRNGFSTNMIFACKFSLKYLFSFVSTSDINYLLLRKFNLRMFFSPCICMATLLRHIYYIIFLCTKKQMFWIYTWWVITLMKHKQTIWNFSIMKFPRKAMGNHKTTLYSIRPKLTIARKICASHPKPTIICFLNFFPKSLGNRLSHCRAFSRAMDSIINFWLMCPGEKFTVTYRAFFFNLPRRFAH